MTLCKEVIGFISAIIYFIQRYRISFDKAFQLAKKSYPKLLMHFDVRKLYELSCSVVRDYVKLVEVLKYLGLTATRKNIVKLWFLINMESNLVTDELRSCLRREVKHLKHYPIDTSLKALTQSMDLRSLSIRYSIPKPILELLSRYGSLKFVEEFAKSVSERVLWVRINTLKIDVDKAKKLLEDLGFEFIEDKDFHYLIKIIKFKRAITLTRLFRGGYVVPQDKASIIVVEALNPQPNDKIIDFAAAPGMKTSLIMQLSENKAKVVAIDISKKRLTKMKVLLRRLGVNTDRVDLVLSDSRIIKLRGDFDKGLIDAPCSGSGTLIKDVAMRIILSNVSRDKLMYYKDLQVGVLSNALRHVNEAIYATCSLFPEEGEEVIEEVIRRFDVTLEVPHKIGIPGYPGFKVSNYVRRLMPHIHSTEAFFISKLVRSQ